MGAPTLRQDRPRNVFTPTNLSIDCRVPAKLKAKIWAHEYFDFWFAACQLPYGATVTFVCNHIGSLWFPRPSHPVRGAHKAKPLTSIDTWTFQIFVGVYTSKFPQEAPALMKYGEVISKLKARGAN